MGLGDAEGQKFHFLNMVMWHIKLQGMISRTGYTEFFLHKDQTGDLGVGSKGQILYVPVNNFFSYGGTGLPGLNQYSARINVSCSRTQHSEADEAQNCGPSS